MEAAKGCNKNITARTQVVCDRCDGKRAEPGTSYSKCPTCKGTGEVSCLGQLVCCLRKRLCLLFFLQFIMVHLHCTVICFQKGIRLEKSRRSSDIMVRLSKIYSVTKVEQAIVMLILLTVNIIIILKGHAG